MQTYSFNEENVNLSALLSSALEDDVIIKGKNGLNYRLSLIDESNTGKSPLEDIKGIKTKATLQDILEVISESRTGM